MKLQDQRAAIIEALTKAVDSCIATAIVHPCGKHELNMFDASIVFTFQGTKDEIRSRPALDFTKDLAPQLSNQVHIVDV